MVKKNKTFRKIAATTAIASSLFVLNNKVNAEELENSTVENETSVTETPVAETTAMVETTTETTTTEISQEEVNNAKEKVDNANAAVSEQESVVAEKEEEKKVAEEAEGKQSEEVEKLAALKEEATPEKISSEENKLEEMKKKVDGLEAKKSEAETELSDKNETVKQLEKEIAKANEDLSKATEKKEAAQDKVEKAQAAIDGTEEGKAVKALEDAKNSQKEKQATVDQKTKELEDAKAADAKLASDKTTVNNALKSAETNKSQVEANKNKANNDKTKAEEAAKKAQTDKDAAETALKEATKSDVVFDKNNAHIQEYVTLLRTPLYGKSSAEKDKILDRLSELSKILRKEMKYNDDKSLSRKVDVTNLSEEDQLRFSKYAEDLHNQIRDAFGTSKVIYNKEMQRFANEVADGYEEDKHSVFGVHAEAEKLRNQGSKKIPIGHDAKAINNVARKYGLSTSSPEGEALGSQYYENMYTTGDGNNMLSVNEVYKRIFDTFAGFMFNGYEYAHASSIADAYSERTDNIEYAGISFSKTRNTTVKPSVNNSKYQLDHEVHTHVLGVDTTALGRRKQTREREFDTSVTPSTIDSLKDKLKKATEALDKANKDAKEASNRLEEATKKANELSTKISELTAEKNKLDAKPEQTDKAVKALDKAKEELKIANQNVLEAQKTVDAFKASLQDKLKALEVAKKNLEEASAEEEAAKAKKATVDSALEEAEKAVENQEEVVKQLEKERTQSLIDVQKQEEYIESLKNAGKNYEDALAKLSELKKITEEKSRSLKDSLDTLVSLKLEALQFEKEYFDLKLAYDAQEAKKVKLVELAKLDEMVQEMLSSSVGGSDNNYSLPNTGVDSSVASLLIGTAFIGLGIGVVKKKENNV